LLLWVYNYELEKFSKGKKPEGLQRLIIVDEAHNVYPKHEGKETVMENMLRQARFLGCGIVLSDQCPSEMSPIALANTMIHINLNQKNKADINAAASNLLLDQEQREHLGHLKLGEAMVRIAGRYTHPFLISIPAVPIKENSVTDSMVKAHMEGLISSDCYSAYSQPDSLKNEGIEPIPLQHKEEELTEQEKIFIEDIINNPYSSISGRYKRLNTSTRKGNRVKQILLNKGIIETEDIIDGNSRILLSKLSKKGESEIKKLGYTIEKLNGKAGLEHEYWRHKIADYLEKLGYQIKMEEPVNGETDIVAILPDPSGKEPVKLAIEIETGKHGPDLAIRNIQKNLKDGILRIISVATNKDTLINTQKKLQEYRLDTNDKIKAILADNFTI
jgi:hypothetical protein